MAVKYVFVTGGELFPVLERESQQLLLGDF